MTSKKKIILTVIFLSLMVIIALLVRAWFYAADKVSQPDSYKEYITKTVSEELKRTVIYEKGTAALTLRDGLSMQFTNLIIKEKDNSSDFLKVDKALVRINILPLLRNRLVFGEVVLHRPRVSLKRDSAGVLNIADLLIRKEDKKAPKIRKIIIEKGSFAFWDQAADPAGLLTLLESFDGRINALFWTNTYRFHINSFIIEKRNRAALELNGFFSPVSSGKPLYESKVIASMQLKGSDLKHYVSYLKKYTKIQHIAGNLDVDMTISGKFSDFKSKGTIILKKSSINYPGVFNGVIQPRLIELNYSMKRDKESLDLDVRHLAIDSFNAKGNFGIDDLDKKDPLLKASAITKVFSFKEIKPLVPWGIIQDDVARFIQEYIKDGKFRLIEGKLKGKLSQIADISGKEGIDVVSIRAEVDQGVLEVDRSAPVFNNISGILELKKRVFSLKKMKGQFGHSPCTLEGNISDFARPQKNIYTAFAKMQPAREEVLWLLGKEKFSDSGFKGASTLFLSGKGTDEKYHLNASWDLNDVAYVYPGVLEKPSKRKNHVTAQIVINDQAVDFTSFKYYLPPVNVIAAARFYYSGKIPLSFYIQSRMFDIREAVPVLPVLRDLKPSGNSSVAVSGKGDLSEPSSIQWNGDIALSGVSVQPWERVKPMQGLTGKAFFRGHSMETSLLKARLGESNIQGSLRINNLANPDLICQLNTNQIQAKDLGLQHPEGDVSLYAVKGQIGIEDKLFRVNNLSFVLGQSSFNLSGDISNEVIPKVTAELSSAYVHSDDFNQLISLKYPEQGNRPSSPFELNATLNINDGRMGDIDFDKLYSRLRLDRKVLEVETLEADIFDGKFQCKGKVYINQNGKNHYETNVSVDKMSLEKIQNYLKLGDRAITGKLSFSGDLSATGSNADELKQTASGTFDVRAAKGVLKKFSVLSKIFSMLNVYQLIKFKLPDMAKDGMPYKKITFHTTLKEGVLNSKDFFIDSDAIQFSATGNVDVIKKKLDMIIGAHPLQTLDLIAAKIPIAGWIVTDERGKLITVNFKIGGTWDNPEVTTITAQSIGKGTVDIFRRIFQLPEKLITDTGEVILGH